MSVPRPILAALVLVAASCVSPSASAYITVRTSSAGAICQPANGGATAMFRRANQYLAHIGTSDQYVVCQLPMENYSTYSTATLSIVLTTYAENAGGTLACSVHNGGFVNGAVFGSSVARSHTFTAAGEAYSMTWESGSIEVIANARDLVLTCKLSPGMRLGTIEHHYEVYTS